MPIVSLLLYEGIRACTSGCPRFPGAGWMCSLPGERRRSPAFSKDGPRAVAGAADGRRGSAPDVEAGDIWIEGSFEAQGEGFCDRLFRPGDAPAREGVPDDPDPEEPGSNRRRIGRTSRGNLDVGYYDGTGVETNDILWEQVALELPVKVVCSDTCRGICPVCGKTGTWRSAPASRGAHRARSKF